jgi:hypothetical protein
MSLSSLRDFTSSLQNAAADAASVLLPAAPPLPPEPLPGLPPSYTPDELRARIAAVTAEARPARRRASPPQADAGGGGRAAETPVPATPARRGSATTSTAGGATAPAPAPAPATDAQPATPVDALPREQLVALCARVTRRMTALERKQRSARAALASSLALLDALSSLIHRLTLAGLPAYMGEGGGAAGGSGARGGGAAAPGALSTGGGVVAGLLSSLGVDAAALGGALRSLTGGPAPASAAAAAASYDDGDDALESGKAALEAALSGACLDEARLTSALMRAARRAVRGSGGGGWLEL